MPSRRSDRGNALRAQAAAAERDAPALEAALEERRRFEDERNHLLRAGWESFDTLDNDTRMDLLRESAAVGFSGLTDLAGGPRRLGLSQAAKAYIKRMSPKLAQKLFAREPRQGTTNLMSRLRKMREGRRQAQSQRDKELQKIEERLNQPAQRPANPAMSREDARRVATEQLRQKKQETQLQKNMDIIADDLTTITAAPVMNIRDAYYRSGGSDWTYDLVDRLLSAGEYGAGRNDRKDSVELHRQREAKQFKEMKKKAKSNIRERNRANNMYSATDAEWAAAFDHRRNTNPGLRGRYDQAIIDEVNKRQKAERERKRKAAAEQMKAAVRRE